MRQLLALLATLLLARSTTLTWPSVPGSSVMKCVTYAFEPSLDTAIARAFGYASFTRACSVMSVERTTTSLVP